MLVFWLATGLIAKASGVTPPVVDAGDGGSGVKEYRFVPELKRILKERAERKEELQTIKGGKAKEARYMVKIAAKEAEKALYSESQESEKQINRAFDKWLAVYQQSLNVVPIEAAFNTFMAQVLARMEQDEEEAILLLLADG